MQQYRDLPSQTGWAERRMFKLVYVDILMPGKT
jgi:hypothetical protein